MAGSLKPTQKEKNSERDADPQWQFVFVEAAFILALVEFIVDLRPHKAKLISLERSAPQNRPFS